MTYTETSMTTTTTTTDDLGDILLEGLRRDADWYRTAQTDLDDYERLSDEVYYNREDDEYIIIISYHSIDSYQDDYDEGEDIPDMETVERDYTDYYRDRYNISGDYTDYEYDRSHWHHAGGYGRDLYYEYGVGRLYLRRG